MPKVTKPEFDEFDEFKDLEETEAEPAPVLSLADLMKDERLPFDLGGGRTIYFIDAKTIDSAGSARMLKLQKLLDGTLRQLEKNPGDALALGRYDKLTTEFVKFVLPDIPDEVLAGLKQGQRGVILKYWTENSDIGDLGKKAARAS